MATANLNELPPEIQDRIMPEPMSGCWLWIGRLTRGDYAQVYYRGRTHRSHRIVYQLFVCDIPDGLELDHTCKLRSCVNPAHLDPVTHLENIKRSNVGKACAAKTHCVKGHPYEGSNLILRPGRNGKPTRVCRICKNELMRRIRPKKMNCK